MSESEISAAEQAAIVAEYDRLSEEPPRPNYTPVGCVMVLLGLAVFVLVPKLLPGLARAGVLAVLVAVIVLVGAGILVYVFGGGGGYSRAVLRVEAALELLSQRYGFATASERRNAAVAILHDAIYADGPGATSTFDFAKARATLGAALPYVQQVEQVLLAERHIYPVFTRAGESGDEA